MLGERRLDVVQRSHSARDRILLYRASVCELGDDLDCLLEGHLGLRPIGGDTEASYPT